MLIPNQNQGEIKPRMIEVVRCLNNLKAHTKLDQKKRANKSSIIIFIYIFLANWETFPYFCDLWVMVIDRDGDILWKMVHEMELAWMEMTLENWYISWIFFNYTNM